MTNWTQILLIALAVFVSVPLSAQIKTNVRTNIPEVDQAKRGLELFKSHQDTTRLAEASDSLASMVTDTLKSLSPDSLLKVAQETAIDIAEDSLQANFGEYEQDIAELRREIGAYSQQLQQTDADSMLLGIASDSLQNRIAQHPEARQLQNLAKKYAYLFQREDKERKDQRKALKKERRVYKKAERRAKREDSLITIRIRLNEIDIEMATLEHDQDSADALLKVLQKELLDSAEIASLAQEFAPQEFAEAQKELANMRSTATDPQKLLMGQQTTLPTNPDASMLPSAAASVPQAPPPLPKYNTLATDLMDPKAFTEGKFKDKQHLLDEGHQQLSELKQKYTKVPDSGDLKSAVKKNSLKEEPLHKRFFITGTNNIQITRSFVAVEFNGQLGYQFNRVWRAGVGGSLNTEWYAEKPYVRWKEGHKFSWNVFGQYTFFKSYIAHLEFEPVKTPAGGETPSEMRHKLLVGVGKTFAIPKLKNVDGVLLLLYDTTSGENFGNRFKVRFGVNVSL